MTAASPAESMLGGGRTNQIDRKAAQAMKIMQITSGQGVGGATTHCLLLARELAQRGHQMTLLCPPKSWIAERAATEGFPVLQSELRRWPPDDLRRIADFVRQAGIELIHTHMSRAHSFGILLRWTTGVPCVATAHRRSVQLHWMFNDLVIAVSNTMRRFHESYNLVKPNRIVTIHNFADDRTISSQPGEVRQDTRQSLNLADDDFLIGTIGSVVPSKGQLYVVRALPRILAEVPRAKLLIVGELESESYVDQINREAEALGVSSHLLWAGRRDDVHRILPALDLSVLASLKGDFPLALLEAMAAAVPVVASEIGGVGECVEAGASGLLVPPADASALAAAVVSLAGDSPRRRAMGEAGQKRLFECFSTQSQIDGIEHALAEVVRRAHAA